MQNCEMKQRGKYFELKENGEKTSADKRQKIRDESKSAVLSSGVKLVLSVMSLVLSVILMGGLHRQNATFGEMKEQYKQLYEKSREIAKLHSQISAVSDKLQASRDECDRIVSSTMLMRKLKRDMTFIHDTSTALQEHQDTSSLHYQTLNLRLYNVTETWQSRLVAVTSDLRALKAESRSAHGRVTKSINDVDGHLRVLRERLQEIEDGTKRNARVLDRTEQEDAQRVQELMDWNTRRISKLQEQLRFYTKLHDELHKRLEKTVSRAQQWESQLPAVEESVRSMLKLRAQLSETERRLVELMLQVRETEEQMLKTSSEILKVQQDPFQEDMGARHEPGGVQDKVEELIQTNRELNSETVDGELKPGED